MTGLVDLWQVSFLSDLQPRGSGEGNWACCSSWDFTEHLLFDPACTLSNVPSAFCPLSDSLFFWFFFRITLSTLLFCFYSTTPSHPLLLSLQSATLSLPSLPSLHLLPSTCCFLVRRCALISWKLQSSSRKAHQTKRICMTPQLSTVLIKCAKCSCNYKNLLSKIRCPVVNHEKNNDVYISVIICGSRLLAEGKWHSLVLPDMLRLLSDTEAPLTSWHCWVHHVHL